MAETDVLVVGAGPTGLMLACELALAGIRVRVLELLDTIGGLEPAIRPWADRTTLVASNPAVDPGVYRKERVPGVVLVRPDGYVAWAADRGSDLEAEVGSVLAPWCGAGASTTAARG